MAPSDTTGYRQRLEQFLQQYNPATLGKVANVVASVGEVEAFTTVYKKYRVVDYQARVTRFFRTYGPEHLDQVDSILQDWDKRRRSDAFLDLRQWRAVTWTPTASAGV